MKIARIQAFNVDIPLKLAKKFGARAYEAFASTVIRIETDGGIVGWSEVCPVGALYQPENTLSVRAALEEMGSGLVGEDPTQIGVIWQRMRAIMTGGDYTKAGIDIACWDIAGKAYGRPVYGLIGGKIQGRARCYCDIAYGPADEVRDKVSESRERGYKHFQVKVGRGGPLDVDVARIRLAGEGMLPGETLVVDANKSWKAHEALRVLHATEGIDFYVEQPCRSYEECLSLRPKVRQPMILDECMTDMSMVLRGLKDDAFEGLGCKIVRMGGITGLCLVRDVCTAAGKFITCDDAWGSDLSVAATTHVATATTPAAFFGTYVSSDFSQTHYDPEASRFDDGFIQARPVPGLGVEPRQGLLGEPLMEFA